MPFGATYCHSGPSCPNSQFFQVLPPSVDSPQPLPTVPYQICPRGPNPNACTKSQEMECAAISDDERIRSHTLPPSPVPRPGRKTKIPCPYVPTQIALSGARAIASTCTPHPDESGRGGIAALWSNARNSSTISLGAYRQREAAGFP